MGRKVHPVGYRLVVNKAWESRWFADGKEYRENLHQDFKVRTLDGVDGLLAEALSRVTDNQARINMLSALNDRYEAWRSFLKETFLYFAVALSIFLFFFELRRKDA